MERFWEILFVIGGVCVGLGVFFGVLALHDTIANAHVDPVSAHEYANIFIGFMCLTTFGAILAIPEFSNWLIVRRWI